MTRQFVGYIYNKGAKNASGFLRDLTKFLLLHDLDRAVSSIRVERHPQGNLFCFFIGLPVTSGAGEASFPAELEKYLVEIVGSSRLGVFDWSDISRMVGPEINPAEGSLPLAYHVSPPPVVEDLGVPEEAVERGDQTEKYNLALVFLSAVRSGSWEQFRQIVREIWGASGPPPRSVARRLQLLGHIERSKDRWSIAPAVLVRTPSDSEFVLCGQRSMHLLNVLSSRATVRQSSQPNGDGPSRVVVQTDDVTALAQELQYRTGVPIAISSAEKIARLLPPIDAWQAQLESVKGVVPARFSRCQRFNVIDFVDAPFDESRSGFYRFWQTHDPEHPAFEGYWDADRGVWYRGDWYGLRFLAQRANGSPAHALYDPASRMLKLPELVRPPDLYERALTLSGGWLPERRQSWLVYRDVSQEIVQLLRGALNLSMGDPDV